MTRPPDDNTPPDAPHAPGTDTDPHRGEVSEAAWEERADSLREPQSYGEAAAWKLVQEVRWQRDEWKAECERLQRENARLQRKANELPGLTATLDEYAHFARLVGECLTQHDESNGCVTGVKQPDGPITARVRAALAGLSPIPERPGDEHPPAPVDGPGDGLRAECERLRREDQLLTCARCGETPHRWRPYPEAGPHWRCSDCGGITDGDWVGGAR